MNRDGLLSGRIRSHAAAATIRHDDPERQAKRTGCETDMVRNGHAANRTLCAAASAGGCAAKVLREGPGNRPILNAIPIVARQLRKQLEHKENVDYSGAVPNDTARAPDRGTRRDRSLPGEIPMSRIRMIHPDDPCPESPGRVSFGADALFARLRRAAEDAGRAHADDSRPAAAPKFSKGSRKSPEEMAKPLEAHEERAFSRNSLEEYEIAEEAHSLEPKGKRIGFRRDQPVLARAAILTAEFRNDSGAIREKIGKPLDDNGKEAISRVIPELFFWMLRTRDGESDRVTRAPLEPCAILFRNSSATHDE